jgi:hypothetical protein
MRISTDLLKLSAAEKRLISAAADAEAELRPKRNGQPPVIRAEVVRALCTGACQKWPVKNRIRMVGGHVRGPLDLSGAHLTHTLSFTRCVFEDRVDLTRARADKPLEWNGGQIGGNGSDGINKIDIALIDHVPDCQPEPRSAPSSTGNETGETRC